MKKCTYLCLFAVIAYFLFRTTHHLFMPTNLPDAGIHIPGSYKSLTMMSAVRAYPNEDIPSDGYVRAFEYSKRNLRKAPRDGNQWEALGPQNIGGRTLDMCLNPQNPNTIYAASASGGLWRSYTGGLGEDVWERINLGYPGLAIGTVEMSPADTNILFVGTGECYGYGSYLPSVSFRACRGLSGIGLLKSTDNGQTWNLVIDWSYRQQQGVQRIKFDPNDPNTVWAATTEGTLKSIDLGETWDFVLDIAMATDIAINPENPDLVFVACGGMFSEGNGIYRTEDGGANWEKMDMGPGGPTNFGGKARIMIAQSSPNIIYASIGQSQSYGSSGTWLCKSENNGDTWEVVNTENYSDYQGWYSHYVGVSPFDENKLFCAGIHLYQSSNGGNTMYIDEGIIQDWFHPDWLHLDHHDIEFHPTDPSIIYFAHDGGIHRTDDGGETFYSCNWGYQTCQFYAGFSNSFTDSAFAMGGLQDNFSCIYEGEKNWRRVVGGDGSWSAINQENNNNIYNSYQYLSLRRSDNQGYSYTDITPPQSGANTNFISPYLLSTVDNQTIYAGRSIVFKSVNGGYSWTATNASSLFDNNPALTMGMSSTSTDVVYVATWPWNSRAQVWKTLDGGEEWIDITGNLPDRIISDLHVDVVDHNIVYAVIGGYEVSHLYKTIDGGENWVDIGSSLPDSPGWSVVNDPSNPEIVFYGNEFGVYVSYDDGDNWQEYNEGMGDGVFAMDLTISPANNKLRVATHGNGVYERSLDVISSIAEKNNEQTDFDLRNYPNPFSSETIISFSIKESSHVNISVYDVSGRLVSELLNGPVGEGYHEMIWSPSLNVSGKGIYFCKLNLEGKSQTIKLIKH